MKKIVFPFLALVLTSFLPAIALCTPVMQPDEAGFGLFAGFISLLAIVIIIMLALVFKKAGKPVWAVIIPIYNYIVFLQIVKKPWYWIFLMAIPIFNIYFSWKISLSLAYAFGKSIGFAVGLFLLFPIFFIIIALDKSKYQPDLICE